MKFLRNLVLMTFVSSALLLSGCSDSGESTKKQAAGGEFGQKVRDYLLKNPEILIEMSDALKVKQEKKDKETFSKGLASNADNIFRSNFSPVSGNKNGDVKVVEFFDYNCPFCKRSFKDLEKLMAADDKIKVIFKEMPIFGGASQVAAEVALAAKKQGKYFETHKALLESKAVSEEVIFKIAKSIGLNIDKLKKDMKLPEIQKEIEEVRKLADVLKIQGTPAYLVNDEVIYGAPRGLAHFQSLVKKARENTCKFC